MKNLTEIFSKRNKDEQKLQFVENWQRQRIKGKRRFVLIIGLMWSLLTITSLTLLEYLLDDRIRIEIFLFKVLLFSILGVVFGFILWRNGERKYKKYLDKE